MIVYDWKCRKSTEMMQNEILDWEPRKGHYQEYLTKHLFFHFFFIFIFIVIQNRIISNNINFKVKQDFKDTDAHKWASVSIKPERYRSTVKVSFVCILAWHRCLVTFRLKLVIPDQKSTTDVIKKNQRSGVTCTGARMCDCTNVRLRICARRANARMHRCSNVRMLKW